MNWQQGIQKDTGGELVLVCTSSVYPHKENLMKKEDIIYNLQRKIRTNRSEAKHYHDKAHEEPSSYAEWKELQGYYEGRVSAFEHSLRMLEDL